MVEQTNCVSVLGAGSWGTALAIQFARAGLAVRLWGRDGDAIERLHAERVNNRSLPDAPFPPTLGAEADFSRVVAHAEQVLISVPSHAFRDLLEQLRAERLRQRSQSADADIRLSWATKGLELATGLLPHQVVREVWPECHYSAVLSGPTFAREVGKGLPTAITVASADAGYASTLSGQLSSPPFRAYTASDITGVEVGGAVKNVLAIGAGLSDGLGFGANARVALITRGLAEMSRLGLAMGAQAATFMGLAGMGDLVLTCTDDQSRNRRMGLALAAGKTREQAELEIGQVVEGVQAASAVHEQAARLGVDMPIVEQVFRVVAEGVPARDAVAALLAREARAE